MTVQRPMYTSGGFEGLRRRLSSFFHTSGHAYESLGSPSDSTRPRIRRRWTPAFFLLLICICALVLQRHTDIFDLLYPPEYRILIVQQLVPPVPDPESEFYERDKERLRQFEASIASHERYAQVWGYGYTLEERNWAAETGQTQNMNKIYGWIDAMEQELAKWRGAEWLLHTDADTLIYDPRIALEYLLPPGPGIADPKLDGLVPFLPLEPAPLLVGNQDVNGWNDGVLFLRVCEETLDFLKRTMELEPEVTVLAGRHPKDQHLLGWSLRLEEHAHIADAFYEIPSKWANSYQINKEEGSQIDDGIEWTPQLQVHLVNHGIWFEANWTTDVMEYAEELYDAALQIAQEEEEEITEEVVDVIIRRQFLQSQERERTLYAVRHWWAKSNGGIANMSFPEY